MTGIMKNKKSFFLLFFTFAAIVLGVIHVVNRYVFSRVSNRNQLNSVWKSKYGDIAFTELGEGKPLLLIHSISVGAGSHEWDKNIQEYAKTRRVYALELPGFANSQKAKITYNSYYLSKVINDFIEKIIGERTDVIALSSSSGLVLAGARFKPVLYNKIAIVNPFDEGMGSRYYDSRFVKFMLPLPIVGTLVYNFISSKQSVLFFLDKAVPVTENYEDVRLLMKKQYANAHKFGSDNKYMALSYIKGYMQTPIYSLIKGCKKELCVIVSGGSAIPLIPFSESCPIVEIEKGDFYPNIYAFEEFNEVVDDFFQNQDECSEL